MGRKWWIAGAVIFILAGTIFYFRWSSAIRQPLEFSHASHVQQGIACSKCHTNLDRLPEISSCVPCHSQQSFSRDVQWVRVYRIAPDIIFSHQQHTDACSTCHSALTSAKRWIHETRFPMDFCMDCHEERGAKNLCGTCHKNRQ